MAHEFSITTRQPEPVATITVTINVTEISDSLAEIFPEVYGFVQAKGGEIAGPPFARYHRMEADGTVEMEAGFPLKAPVGTGGRIDAGELPGGECATTTHVGPYSGLPDAYAAVDAWLESSGRKEASGPWESYVDDPAEVDPENLRTEVYWPLA
jgi:AraC family transcriptional regulator